MNVQDKTLRQILLENFVQIDRSLGALKRAIEIMAKQTVVSDYEMTQLKYQIGSISESLNELEQRVVILENHASVATLVIRHGATLLIGVVIVLLLNYWIFSS